MFNLWERVQTVTPGPASKNLSTYLSQATLPRLKPSPSAPPLPPPGHKSHKNTLVVIPANYRTLETIHKIRDQVFSQDAIKFLNDHIPVQPLTTGDADDVLGEQITVPCGPNFIIPPRAVRSAGDVDGVCRWVEEFPMETLQRIMHMIYPETYDWTFSTDRTPDYDQAVLRHLTWSPTATASSESPIVVIVQPPWILAPRDLELFVKCPAMRILAPGEKIDPQSFRTKERLWAKIWDVCFRKKSRWFVVTTYWGWVFGAFSKGWTRAFCSTVKKYHSTKPTILQCLVYWFASAMEKESGWKIPEVPESVQHVGLESTSSIAPPSDRSYDPVASESSWSGKSSNRFSDISATDSEDDMDVLGPPTDSPPSSPVRWDKILDERPSKPVPTEIIERWKEDLTHNARWGRVKEDEPGPSGSRRSPSPALSISSVSTVRDFADDEDMKGVWLSGNSSERRDDYA